MSQQPLTPITVETFGWLGDFGVPIDLKAPSHSNLLSQAPSTISAVAFMWDDDVEDFSNDDGGDDDDTNSLSCMSVTTTTSSQCVEVGGYIDDDDSSSDFEDSDLKCALREGVVIRDEEEERAGEAVLPIFHARF